MGRGQSGEFGVVAGKGREQKRAALERSGLGIGKVDGSCLLPYRPKPVGYEGDNLLGSVGENGGRYVVTAQVEHFDRGPLQDFIVRNHKSWDVQSQRLVGTIGGDELVWSARRLE